MNYIRILVVTILLCLILYIKYISKENVFFLDIFNFILLSVAIFLLKIPFIIKIAIILSIIAIFRINLSIFLYLANIPFKVSRNIYIGTDKRLRNEVTELFKTKFNFINNFDDLPSFPTMIVTNYIYDRLEHMACIVIPREIAIVMGKAMIDLAKLDKIVNNLILRPAEGGSFEIVKQQIGEKYRKGLSIFTYVTSISHSIGHLNRVRKGMFTIAKELGIPVTPIAIDYIHYNCIGAIVPQNFRISVGETFNVNSVEEARYRTKLFLTTQHRYFIAHKFTIPKIQEKARPKNK